MAYTTIPNLPLATALTGSEQLEIVQNGVSSKTTTGAFAALNQTAGTVTQIITNAPITGGPITTSGVLSLATSGVTNDYLAPMPPATVKGNITAGTANPTDITAAQFIAAFGVGSVTQVNSGAGLTGGPITTSGTLSLSLTTVSGGTYGSTSSVGQFTVDAYGRLTAASEQVISIPYSQVIGLGTIATQNSNAVAITGGNINSTTIGAITPTTGQFTALTATGTTNLNVVASGTWNGSPIDIAYGGTGATTASTARANLSAAKSGVNSDITSLTGLTTPLSAPQGGTGFGSYTTGDILYADSSSTLARLNDVATGNALISGGVGVAPAWGKIDLATHISGTLPIANGGTGQTTASAAFNALSPITSTGDLILGTGVNTAGRLGIGSNGYVLTSDGTTASWQAIPVTGVTSINFGATGLTPSTATSGAVTVAGTLSVGSGGTGATTLTGFLKGNGTSAFTAQATIGNSDLANSSVTIGSTNIALGGTATTISGLTTLTLTQDPTSALQASTKQYVDTQVSTVSNQTFHTAVGYATTADLGTVAYSNGTGGVGATITNAGAQAALTIDGYTFTATDVINATRVLVKDQSSGLQNGIYIVTNEGSISANWQLQRATDFDTVGSGPTKIQTGAAAFVNGGTLNGATSWVMTTSGTIIVGTTSLVFSQTSSAGNILVNSPLVKVGNTISLGTVGVTFGGTGQTSYTAYGLLYAPTTGSIGQIGTGTSGYPLLSGGAGSAPSFSQLSLSGSGVTGTLPIGSGGTGQTTASAAFNALSPITTTGDLIIGNGTNSATRLAIGTNGYVLTSDGTTASWAAIPATGVTSFQTSLSGLTPSTSTTGAITLAGTLGVTSGGTGTTTQFTAGSIIFAGASGVYSQSNTKFFWDNTNNRLGVNTGAPNVNLTVVSNTQTASPPSAGSLPAGTDLYILGADAANTRITQDAYGSGNYPAYTGRQARGTAASPTASQTGDILAQYTGRGYGATGFASASNARIDMEAAENFTDTAQGSYISMHTTALGATSPVERFRVGPSGQWGIGGATYGTTGYAFVSGGASAAPSWSQISLTAGVTGTLPAANGGTGQSSYTTGDILYASSSSALSKLAAVATGNVLLSQGVGTAPAWGQVSLTSAVTGTLPAANGGTGQNTYTVGDLLYASGSTALSKLTAVATGSVLVSQGTGTAPAYSATPTVTSITAPTHLGGTTASSTLTLQSTSGIGTTDSVVIKVGNNGATTALTAASSGTVTIGTLNLTNALGTAYGGTGLTGFTAANNAIYSTSSSTLTAGTLPTAAGGTGLTTFTAANNAIYSTSSSGLTAGTLPVAAGGTGATTLTGVLKGNGTSAFTAATAGTDYVAPATATTFTATQTFSGSSSALAAVLTNSAEVATVSATAATGTINYDVTTQSVIYYTSNASANWTVNFRASSGTSLNTAMSTGQSVTVAFLVTQGSTAYYNNVVQVDGSTVTPKYQGGTAWSAGNASSVDAYVYTIVKTGSAAFTVFASQTKFA